MSQDNLTLDDEATEALWGLEDYAIFVPMTDNFYKTLPFAKITLDAFRSGDYVAQPSYKDSRTYLRPILSHLKAHGSTPQILDVGGYIGRFSIEAALLCRETGTETAITCFEPGATFDLLSRNLALNEVDNIVSLQNCAVSAEATTARFAIPDHAKITSRIVVGDADEAQHVERGFHISDVAVRPLEDYLSAGTPLIAKIDTEGHEADVINGIPEQTLREVPNVLVIEFWPAVMHKRIHGQNFVEFVYENYNVLNIESSLYPKQFELLEDLEGVKSRILNKEANNLDLMLVSKSIPDHEQLLATLRALA